MKKYKSIGTNLDSGYIFIATSLARSYPCFKDLDSTRILVDKVCLINFGNKAKLGQSLC